MDQVADQEMNQTAGQDQAAGLEMDQVADQEMNQTAGQD